MPHAALWCDVHERHAFDPQLRDPRAPLPATQCGSTHGMLSKDLCWAVVLQELHASNPQLRDPRVQLDRAGLRPHQVQHIFTYKEMESCFKAVA